jgi:hypothetical protein
MHNTHSHDVSPAMLLLGFVERKTRLGATNCVRYFLAPASTLWLSD